MQAKAAQVGPPARPSVHPSTLQSTQSVDEQALGLVVDSIANRWCPLMPSIIVRNNFAAEDPRAFFSLLVRN